MESARFALLVLIQYNLCWTFTLSAGLVWSAVDKFTYPEARRDETVKDILHGVEVADPYRWLEDPGSEETKKFVDAQNNVSVPYINSCLHKSNIHQRLTELFDYPRYRSPFRRGNKYFYYMNTGLQNQSVLYMQDTLESPPRTFLDPNKLSKDGTTALSSSAFSEDGKWFAYGLSDSGSDWIRIKVRSVESGEDQPETLRNCKFTSISWTHDNKGFFYACYPQPANNSTKSDGTETTSHKNQKLYYHRVGTLQSEDVIVAQFSTNPKWLISGTVSHCGKYLFVFGKNGTGISRLYYARIDPEKGRIQGELQLTPIEDKLPGHYNYVTNVNDTLILQTDKNAPNSRVVKIDLKNPQTSAWIDLIPEHEKDVLKTVIHVNYNYLVVIYMRDVVDIIEIRKLSDGSLVKKLDTPIGTLFSLSGQRSQSEFFYYLSSYNTPGIIYRCDMKKNFEVTIHREIVPKNFNSSEYVVEQIFYESKDKTKIPMSIFRPKGVALDGKSPCLLYGYGGFRIYQQPTFTLSALLLAKHFKMVYAVASIRGGGEYGQRWHDGGKLLNKQNVFDDFQAAAEYLIQKGYTNSQKLTIEGRSNGGLLVAASANQRPSLYGCVLAHVGVMDMLRFHKFTIGYLWASEYGSPDEETHFKNIYKYSPLHNIPLNATTYPATLVMTADHDDRVVPLHSLKFIAQLQHLLGKKLPHTPLMIRVDVKAGHGGGKPVTKVIDEMTEKFCFMIKSLGLQYYE